MEDTEFDLPQEVSEQNTKEISKFYQEIKEDEEDVNKVLKPLTVLEREIVEKYTQGESPKSIGVSLGLSPTKVRQVLNKDHVKKVTNEVILDTGTALKAERVRLLNAIIEDKLAQMQEPDENGKTKRLADSTSKDLVDLVRSVDDILKEKEKKELGSTEGSVYVQLINNLLD